MYVFCVAIFGKKKDIAVKQVETCGMISNGPQSLRKAPTDNIDRPRYI